MSDDATLLSRYAEARDAEAFAELVRRHAGLVHGTCRRICGNASSADDAAQECFLLLARHAGRIHASLPAWLHTVAVRVAVRLRGQHGAPSLDAVAEPATPELDAWRQLAPHLDEALAALPDDQRTVVLLRHLEGQSQAEIAAQLGLSQPTVSRRLDAAIAALRRHLTADQGAGAMAAILPDRILDLAHWQAPSHIVAAAGKIGIAGIAPLPAGSAAASLVTGKVMVWALAAAVAAAIGATLWLSATPSTPPPPMVTPLATTSPSIAPPTPASTPADPPPKPASDDLLLDHPVTACVHDWTLPAVVDLLLDQLPVQNGARIEIVPATVPEQGATPRIDLAADGIPLHAALDQVVAGTAWRWRALGPVVYLDRPQSTEQRGKLIAFMGKVVFSPDGAPRIDAGEEDVARTVVRIGDLDTCGDLLALLANPRFAGHDAEGRALDLAVCHALAECGATWMDWLPRGNPLGFLAGDPKACAGVVAAWARCQRLHVPPTPYLIYLAGELRIHDLAAPLLAVVRDPMPGLAADQPSEAIVISRTRQWAARALGRMGDAAAMPVLADLLAKNPNGPEALNLAEALGAGGHAPALPTIAAMPVDRGDWIRGTILYVTVARLDEAAVPALVARGGFVNWGGPDGFIGYPEPALLPHVLQASTSTRWWDREAFWKGTGRMSATAVAAAIATVRENANVPLRAALDCLAARDGDDAALARLDGADPAERDCLDFQLAAQCAARLSPTRGKALVAQLAPTVDPAQASAGTLGLLTALPPPDWAERLAAAWSATTATTRPGIVPALAARAQGADLICRRLFDDRYIAGCFASTLDAGRFDDGPLSIRFAELLKRLEPRTAAMVALGGIGDLDFRSANLAIAWLAAADPNVIQPESVRRLGDEDTPTPDVLVQEFRQACVPILLRWSHDPVHPLLRKQSVDTIAALTQHDFTAERLAVLADFTASLATEPDVGTRDALTAALKGFISENAEPDGWEMVAEAEVMAGSLDDLDLLPRFDQARIGAAKALAPPAPPKTDNF